MNTYKLFSRVMAVSALTLCCWSCTDDWDEHYDASEGGNGAATLSLWEQIESNPDLEHFKTLCTRTKFVAKQGTKLSNYTFADLLKTTGLTVFAPKMTKEQCDSLLETGLVSDDSMQVFTSQKRFLANHISRMQYTIVPGGPDSSMYMLNAKKSILNQQALTLNGVPLDPKNLNIPTTNGKLNILERPLPYAYNLYEYLKDSLSTAGYNKFNQYVLKNDTSIFRPELSIEANEPDANGDIVYVEKFYEHTNQLFRWSITKSSWDYNINGLSADLNCEDSAFVMVIPTDKAWDDAISRIKKYFVTARTYENNSVRDQITSEKGSGADGIDAYVATLVKNESRISDFDQALDSLAEVKARSYLMKYLTFNIRTQRNAPSFSTPDVSYLAFDAWKDAASFIVTTRGDTLRNLPYDKYALSTDERRVSQANEFLMSEREESRTPWDFTSIFDNKAPIRMSNGAGYVVDNFNYDLRAIVHNDIRIEAEYNVYQKGITSSDQSRSASYFVHDTLQVLGLLSNNVILDMNPKTGSVKTKMEFKLSNAVRSGTYDIYVVVAPYSYLNKTDKSAYTNRQARFTATLNYLEPNSDKAPGKDVARKSYTTGTEYAPDSAKVDTVLLFKDFKFPVSYEGMPNSYPTLTIQMIQPNRKYSGAAKPTTDDQTNNLTIDFIYLKAKEDVED